MRQTNLRASPAYVGVSVTGPMSKGQPDSIPGHPKEESSTEDTEDTDKPEESRPLRGWSSTMRTQCNRSSDGIARAQNRGEGQLT